MPYVRQEDRRAQKERWNAANPERVRELAAKWREENRAYFVEYRKKNRERMRGYKKLADERLRAARSECAFCGDKAGPFHLDHIIPKSRGGSGKKANLQWLCATCNISKGALTPEEFFDHIRKVLARRSA